MMKRGAKRPALTSDSAADAGPQSKRVMDAPSFDVHRVESSHHHLMAGPPLDPQRAESAHQHVRALNSQFASWVQLQLQKHPDELWEDGVSDYLSHASRILEKFKDVVNWLRANSARQRSVSFAEPTIDQKNLVDVSEDNKRLIQSDLSNGFAKQQAMASISSLQKSSPQSSGPFSFTQTPDFAGTAGSSSQKGLATLPENKKTTFPSNITNGAEKQATPASFSSFHNSGTGLFSFSQKPALSGIQSDTTPKVEASGDVDEEDDLEKPSSPSLEKAEEKGIIVVHEAKCKVYLKPDNPADKGWKDMGMGHLSIKCKEGAKKATKDSRPVIIIRNDVGKILLNALIYPGIKMNIQKNTIASIFHTMGGGHGAGADTDIVARTYLLRLKNEEETTKLAIVIKDHAPSE